MRVPVRSAVAAVLAGVITISVLAAGPHMAAAASQPAASAHVFFPFVFNTHTPGTVWSQLWPLASPPPRDGAAMAYDAATQTTLLFGGYSLVLQSYLNDTWTWNGATWTQQFPKTVPPARYGASMAYDDATRSIVLFGGSTPLSGGSNDTWTWDGSDWTLQQPATAPPGREATGMAYDAARQQIVLFGGYGFLTGGTHLWNDTWTWDGTNWTRLSSPTAPLGRFGFALAYDELTQSIVLFGGEGFNGPLTLFNDTWTWNGTDWQQQFPPTAPSGRFATAVYDRAVQKVVLFGGAQGPPLNDTWAWDGARWTQENPRAPPAARYDPAMAYDVNDEATIVFGGQLSDRTQLNDTWSLTLNR